MFNKLFQRSQLKSSNNNFATKSLVYVLSVSAVVVIIFCVCVLYMGVRLPQQTDKYRELAENIKKWEEAGIDTYTIDARILCFCNPDVTRPFRVVVNGDSFTVTYLDNGLLSPPRLTDHPFVGPVNRIFASLREILINEADRLEYIKFDANLGYPKEISLDPFIVDGSVKYLVIDMKINP